MSNLINLLPADVRLKINSLDLKRTYWQTHKVLITCSWRDIDKGIHLKQRKHHSCTLVTNPFLRWLECYFGIYFPRCFATREINTKITLSWALKRFVTRLHTLFSISLYCRSQPSCFQCTSATLVDQSVTTFPAPTEDAWLLEWHTPPSLDGKMITHISLVDVTGTAM